LKKCAATTSRPGFQELLGSSSSVMLEVLLARTAAAPRRGSACAYSAALCLEVLKIASIRACSASLTPRRARRRASGPGGGAFDRIAQAFGQKIRRALQCRIDKLLFAVLERDLQAPQGTPGRDIPAHDTCADHVHPPEGRCGLAAQGLEAVLQQEHAHQAPGGLTGKSPAMNAASAQRRRVRGRRTDPQINDA